MNNENLISISERTKSEQRKITKKGGKNSGKKRRKLKYFREALTELLTLKPSERKDCEKLTKFGLEETNQMLTIVAFFESLVGKRKIPTESYKLLLKVLEGNKLSENMDPLARLQEMLA